MAAKNGAFLSSKGSIEAIKEKLFPLAALITPNLSEASALLSRPIGNRKEMEQAGIDLLNLGPKAVLIKGGHLEDGDCDDCLCVGKDIHWFSSPRIATKNTHGTGCTFSSAIASFLAKGEELAAAVRKGKQYVTSCIEAGASLDIGRGRGPLHHFFSFPSL